MGKQISESHFTQTLIDWFSKAKRSMPWRETRDPYRIWLSEIILQQTRVDQGLPYYNRFVGEHPTVDSLAEAEEREILKLWEGLGYYSRARNLHHTARQVSGQMQGRFPDSYKELIKLKGVGPYTAAAIASISFGEPKPVVDGNVFRFVSRYFGVWDDISKAASRKVFEKLLDDFIDPRQPGEFNQAIMEFGATVCTPTAKCVKCVFREGCFARKNSVIEKLPVKQKKVKTQQLNMDYLVFHHGDHYLLQSRSSGIWKGLYQFYLDESNDTRIPDGAKVVNKSEPVRHLLTHRVLWVTFTRIEAPDEMSLKEIGKHLGLNVFTHEEMLTLPKPKVIVNYLLQELK